MTQRYAEKYVLFGWRRVKNIAGGVFEDCGVLLLKVSCPSPALTHPHNPRPSGKACWSGCELVKEHTHWQ